MLLICLFCISVNMSRWPLEFLFMFLAVSIQSKTKESVTNQVVGISLGIVASFIIIQGLAFVFRPYDEDRYKGMFYNSNVAA